MDWLSYHEVYITDVLSTWNYTWPNRNGDKIYPDTNIFDIYNSTNGFTTKFVYKSQHRYSVNLLYTYCLEDHRIGNFFKDAFRNSSNFTLGFTMLTANPFECYGYLDKSFEVCDYYRCGSDNEP